MCGNILFLAAVLGGIDAGWEPLPEGGVQYLIQIDPGLLESRGLGESLESCIPPQVQDVRVVRISVGTGPLPRELPPEPAAEPEDNSPVAEPEAKSWSLRDPQREPADLPPDGPVTDPFTVKPPSYTPPPPQTFHPDPDGQPIAAQTGHEEPLGGTTAEPKPPPSTARPSTASQSTSAAKLRPEKDSDKAEKTPGNSESGKPWWPLTLVFFGLFASLGVNGFLLWIVADFRSRYRALLRRMGDLGSQ